MSEMLDCPQCNHRSVSFGALSGHWICLQAFCDWSSRTRPGKLSEDELAEIKADLVSCQAACTRLLGEVERLQAENQRLHQEAERRKDQYES